MQQSNAQGRASARYAFVEAMSDIDMAIAQEKQAALVWRRGLADPQALDDDEVMQLWMMIGQYGNAWMVMYHLHEDGLLPDNHWRVVQNDILGSAGGRAFWKMGASAFDASFRAFVGGLLASSRTSYDMLAR